MELLTRVGSLLLLLPLVACKHGFLFTSSKSLTSNTTETFLLTLYDAADVGSVSVSLRQTDGNETKTLQSITHNVEQPSPASGQKLRLSMLVPVTPSYTQVSMVVEGKLGSYTFSSKTDITLYTRHDATFIQTDKPIYKPGQLVRFRILPVDPELRPLADKAKADVWIENPNGIRLAQWLNVTFEKGMTQNEMQLSEQPNLGQWTIYVNVTTTSDSKGYLKQENFQVEEYVLPKFEVIVTPPPFVLTNAENITWKICGRYTYGKLVKGNLTVKVGYESYGSWDNNVYPEVTYEDRIDGCTNYTVYKKDLAWLNYTHRYRPLKMFAKITEDGTEVQQNGTGSISLTTNPATISFTYPDYNSRYFKPGMPFIGELTITNPDNTPKPDELVQICVMPTTENMTTHSHATNTELACKNFTSNEKGIVFYAVPPKNGNLVNLKLQADAVNFPTTNYDDNVVMIYQPSNTLQLRPWYSAARRFIQIKQVTKKLDCGEKHDVTVYLTGEDGETFSLYSQVMSRGGIMAEQMSQYQYSEIKSPMETDETYITKSFDEESAPTPTLGKVTITITADYEMSPKGYLLVYYTRPDGEIIADSIDFEIEKCLKNKVGMEFLSQKQLPGTNVGVRVSASPNSYCGIGAVDKSVYLLRSGNTLSTEKIFDILNSYGSNRYGYSYVATTCIPQKTPGPASFERRRRGIISPPYRISQSYADSLTAFQNGNFLVLTDLTLVTKPCSSSSGSPPRPYYSGRSLALPTRPSLRRSRVRLNFHTTDDEEFLEEVQQPQPMRRPPPPRPSVAYGGANKIGAAPAAFPQAQEMDFVAPDGAQGGGGGGFKPVVEVRNFFPETWLWEMVPVDAKGEFLGKRELPHTITEWIGSAVCLHPEDGMGVSNKANVTAFQPFFVSATLPYSVIRGEISPVIISVFNYLKECLAITLRMDEDPNFTLTTGSLEQSLCVCGGDSVTHQYLVKLAKLGQQNFTVRAFTNSSSNVCGNNLVGSVTARDAATNSLLVEAEGFKRQDSFSNFFCPSQSNGSFTTTYTLALPENAVQDSARAEFIVTGDLMGPALRNIDNLVQMPTGCGEQNMLNFVPDIFILDYLTQTGKLTAETNKKLLDYLKIGYQRELTYRHIDGSYSAFGERDNQGSIWLTAFVVKAYAGAKKYIFVDPSDISRSVTWIEANQDPSGCFPDIGEVHHSAMKGGSGSNLGSKATMSSYIIISLLEAKNNVEINDTTVERAKSCLAQEKNPTTYTLALMTYASCLAKDASASERLESLMSLRKSKGEADYWEDDSTKSKSIQIEIASYAILSLLACECTRSQERSLPIVRWISQQRNANGGFLSTQDTVMALQALAAYATNIDKDPININVHMDGEGATAEYHVDETNKLLVQSTKLPTVPTPVEVKASGSGCSLVQANLFYNVMTPPGFQAFHLNISTQRGVGGSCKKADMTTCMSYEFEGRNSNMAVLELRLPSGFDADKGSLELLKHSRHLTLKRYDIDGNKLALYFSAVGPVKQCFSIRLEQTFEVHNLKPVPATLFDYYQPENQVSQAVNMDEHCP